MRRGFDNIIDVQLMSTPLQLYQSSSVLLNSLEDTICGGESHVVLIYCK